ncbi:geranylgeranyl diphosphate synthase [Apiospora saccharicola]|uniref:Geranylgeranyl diphosphate synthase n=1 Tax=Apiospora saccharicola TaxID=335842 RepID=A0ABR1V8S7_9PEZI
MEYRYSQLLHSSQYETEGLCDGLLVRKHNTEDLEEVGTFKAQEDWRTLVAPISKYKGGLGPRHSFMAVSLPECLPDRFEIVSYANEFAFLHDDVTDVLRQKEGDAENDEVLNAFRQGAETGSIDALDSGKRQMQAKILNAMISIDRPRALTAVTAWAAFMEQGAGRRHHDRFRTLDEYLPYRTQDVGHMFWHALVTFGCAISLSEEETRLCAELVMPAVVAASLTNDLFSYEKEYEATQAAGLTDVVNALWVLMGEHGISLDEAKALCRRRIKKEVAKYACVVNETRRRDDLSSDVKRYIELMQYSVSGNVIWSLQCPRYHKDMQYNQRQVLRETEGIANHPSTQRLVEPNGNCYDQFRNVCPTVASGIQRRNANKDWDWDVFEMTRRTALPKLGQNLVLEPYQYVSSLPSKGIRDIAIDGINLWLGVSPKSTAIIRNVVGTIHNSSIMLDDLQDGSQLRRGRPATHVVFGMSQTINSATFQYVQAIAELQNLANPLCLGIFIDEMSSLFVGQGLDLYWTNKGQCPSVGDYLQMVDGSRTPPSPQGRTPHTVQNRLTGTVLETGGLFRLLVRLMTAESKSSSHNDQRPSFDRLCRLLGRYFQIRDDYQNLVSDEYATQKGFCEDLDEGKFSLPLIHALAHTDGAQAEQLQEILSERRIKGKCTVEHKRLVLARMHDAGSLDYVLHVLQMLDARLDREVEQLERAFDQVNHQIRLMLALLKV